MLSPLRLVRFAGSIGHEAIRYGWSGWLRPWVRELTEKPGIREVLPGVHHWTRVHPRIRAVVSSYYVAPVGVLIDPLVPREGLQWFEGGRRPEQVVMTIRHHLRDGERFAEAFGCELRCHVDGLHEFADGPDVRGFDFGDELAPGVTALEVDAISPDESALHLEYGGGAIVLGDGLIRPEGGPLRFVPDFLIGDDPERVKRELSAAFDRLLELEFDTLLFAHGDPLVGAGKQALREFVAAQS
ncbi:MAG TPA: hypothetical protein VFY45_15940 [Baekduia sp.]|nr:hypothetical protein [Baekduia sp.]